MNEKWIVKEADSVMDELERERNQIEAQDKVVIDELKERVTNLEKKLSDEVAQRDSNKELLLEANNSIETLYKGKILDKEERIKELEASQPKWISVEDDEKPKEDKEILFTDGEFVYKGYWTTWAEACSDFSYVVGSGFVDEVNDESFTEEQITHWMPLPEAPKSED